MAEGRYTGTDGADNIAGSTEGDVMVGLAGDDKLFGGRGDDYLYGNEGHDSLYGGEGADVLYGDEGADHLWGGIGADRFVFSGMVSDDSPDGMTFAAQIEDFSKADGDRIDLSGIDADPSTPGDQAFAFLGQSSTAGPGGAGPDAVGLSFRHVGGDQFTVVDIRTEAGSSNEGYMQIILNGFVDVTPSDFFL